MIDKLINQIIQNPLFLKLKNVVEVNPYHNHEDAYSHSIKVKDAALEEIKADFITNPEAKNKFIQFINETIEGFSKKDLIVLVALLHDIGKPLSFQTNPDKTTSCPQHEYLGSTIVGQVVKDLSLPQSVVQYMSNIIKFHGTFGGDYFSQKNNLNWDLLINDIKSQAHGLYKETLFNVYCDCFNAQPFQEDKEKIVKIFNDPNLYD